MPPKVETNKNCGKKKTTTTVKPKNKKMKKSTRAGTLTVKEFNKWHFQP